MKKVNRGKDFEAEIEECLSQLPEVSFDRIPDQMTGLKGSSRNICDFVMFHAPDAFYLECKAHYGNTLNYKSDIRDYQWEGLERKSKINRCIAGVCVWFIDYDITAFVNIKDLVAHRDSGAKSLNIKDITSDGGIPHILIDGLKKRVMFKYFGKRFLNDLHKLCNDVWGEYNGQG